MHSTLNATPIVKKSRLQAPGSDGCAENVCPHGLTLTSLTTRVEGHVEFDIPYMPHYNTLTETGKANFSRIPDALAELLDNSIQVLAAKGERAGPFWGTRLKKVPDILSSE